MPHFLLFTSITRLLIKIENNVGDNVSPCLTPTGVSNQSVYLLFK